MWFLFAMITWVCWGAANLFYKKGSDIKDKNSHAKIAIMVGIVMGIHATIYMFANNLDFQFENMIKYLPISALYITSMIFGYVGLRYLELSIAAPLQNTSGAITVILLYIFFPSENNWIHYSGIAIITFGVVWIAVIERHQDEIIRKLAGVKVDKKYQYGFVALVFPLLYAILDGVASFGDGIVLDNLKLLTSDEVLIAYEYTFFIVAIIYWLYLYFVKKEFMNIFKQKDRTIAAVLETGGQFFYVKAMASYAIISAPIIASFFIFSIILGRIFLKEKLSKRQYFVIFIIMIGIVMLGVADEI
ncbi:EamA family transporter [Kurthia sibirica]|uniref:EamA domain-containing protein n=1 Tax=Kurthia sibirica TaxID=202750 RepID=A0A2U3AI42_9BACL|nr:EamA family transporter [Kurthia sibirica]PWI24121.1 hypothetical protein DEX24_15110 [Kurthia sibirica]GEK35302.1 hypothetical protein KSI01_28350 [Kurthia sibirica]